VKIRKGNYERIFDAGRANVRLGKGHGEIGAPLSAPITLRRLFAGQRPAC